MEECTTYLKHCEAVHHYIFITRIRQEVQTVAPGSCLLSKVVQQLLCKKKQPEQETKLSLIVTLHNRGGLINLVRVN